MGMKKEFWNPWHGCHKCSPGCLHCYVYYLDGLREVDASVVRKSKSNFRLPLKRDRKGNFKIEPGSEVATCFTSDFFLPEDVKQEASVIARWYHVKSALALQVWSTGEQTVLTSGRVESWSLPETHSLSCQSLDPSH